ncbi:MarR family winged helix-turn-helix transcriptional regulator [Mesorhizobium sp. ZMM04-5]|uniref:MarR family winged helix-turn-helix transcriptional regulator n=1 Tax=Mesorhizobium marinum TaxID=3228790 RepID=A0ABV3QYA4_9HYPH
MDARNRTVELIERMARAVANEGHAHGLKPAQWDALRYLSRANRFSRTPGALTAYLGSTKGTVSQTVMSLERVGLVEKAANPGDRRSVRLALTPAGWAMLEKDEIETLRHAVDELSNETRQGLEAGLDALLGKRIAAGGGRPFGMCRTCRHFAGDSDGPGRHFCRLLHQPLADAEAGQICYEQEAA